SVTIDPRMSTIYVEEAGLVGIEGPSEELLNLLTDTEEKLKVVSILGFGGLGKTTLAKQVYDEIRGKFECTAFVSVSQRPNMTGLLYRIQLKLGMNRSSRVYEVQDIIEDLRQYLTHKRYYYLLQSSRMLLHGLRCADTSESARIQPDTAPIQPDTYPVPYCS
uniref:NB-ARC domain-containing protein n=1 Tax=Aegilops tauschii subsp. strangulata TaxID=200361 RepID=A0A453A1T9_AEGTS